MSFKITLCLLMWVPFAARAEYRVHDPQHLLAASDRFFGHVTWEEAFAPGDEAVTHNYFCGNEGCSTNEDKVVIDAVSADRVWGHIAVGPDSANARQSFEIPSAFYLESRGNYLRHILSMYELIGTTTPSARVPDLSSDLLLADYRSQALSASLLWWGTTHDVDVILSRGKRVVYGGPDGEFMEGFQLNLEVRGVQTSEPYRGRTFSDSGIILMGRGLPYVAHHLASRFGGSKSRLLSYRTGLR